MASLGPYATPAAVGSVLTKVKNFLFIALKDACGCLPRRVIYSKVCGEFLSLVGKLFGFLERWGIYRML